MVVLVSVKAPAQTIYEYTSDDAKVLFFDKNLSQNIPHLVRMYEEGKAYHTGIWNIDTVGKASIQPPLIMVKDWGDCGNGGVSAIPANIISIDMAPLDYSYFISPAVERYHHLFRHEYTHTVMTDKTAAADRFWRSCLGGKFTVEPEYPISAIWSFLSAPRWYCPRWYHEGIACFMETWLGGGVGRALGGYDEMYFRSIVDNGSPLYSVVGLETEGTTSDFQVGTNSYLYGTRFVNYLELEYGLDKLLAFYNRTDDSKALFNHQFEDVYGKSLRTVWDEWRDFEIEHQKRQIASIEEYPVTNTEKLSDKALGSMSPLLLDSDHNCAYAAVNFPGDLAHIERIDLGTLERKRIHTVESPQLYQTCYMALDLKRQRLIWTSSNSMYRGLVVYDIKKGKVIEQKDLQRTSCLVYDNARDYLYGVMTNQGTEYLCRYSPDLKDRELLYSFPFGLSVFDIDVSSDGKYLSATTSGDNGEQSLIRFDVDGLLNGNFTYETLYTAPDFNLGQFRFAENDKVMIGSSYYTGVSNIWKLSLEDKELQLLSNTRIGLFSPVVKNDTIYCLEFERNGMRPVRFTPEVIEDANSVTMLGQLAYEAHPEELEDLSVSKVPFKDINFAEVMDSIKVYKPRLKFTGAFPDISGFRDNNSFNNVVPVLGYRFIFQDPLGLNSLKMSVGISPWSSHEAKNQYHAQFDWKYWFWTVKAAWNPTSFYDLAGPICSSRKGWQLSVSYDKSRTYLPPVSHNYGFSVSAYGMIDALPLFQNIYTGTVKSFQTATAYYQYSRVKSSLGSVGSETGTIAAVRTYAYLAGGKLYPYLQGNYERGFLMPFMRNTSLWFRGAVGQHFGIRESIFGNEYFGGFGNNYVDYRAANRYRTTSSFAGEQIDAISAHSFAKLMVDLNLRPIRYNDVGVVNLYPTYTQFNVFTSGLIANPWEDGTQFHSNVGVQVNTEVVLFKFLKTTWSVGYARSLSGHRGDWLFCLKLL